MPTDAKLAETLTMKIQNRWFVVLLISISAAANLQAKTPVCTTPELESATYAGIEETPVTLEDGQWEGQPYVKGGAARPRVGLVQDICLSGDLDGDGIDEQVAILWQNASGTGSYIYIAVMSRKSGEFENISTARVGDRVKIKDGRVKEGKIVLNVLQAGKADAMCCPTPLATRRWSLGSGQLHEAEIEITGRLTSSESTD